MKTCCVTGMRKIPLAKIDYVRQKLHSEIEQAIADGFTSFISSMISSVDLEFATIVTNSQRAIVVSDGCQNNDMAQLVRMASAKKIDLHVIKIEENAYK